MNRPGRLPRSPCSRWRRTTGRSPRVDLAGVRVHDDGRDALGPVGDPGGEELLLDPQLEAGVDGQAQVRAGHARLRHGRLVDDRLAARVALGDDDPRLAGERRLVGLLDAVLAVALAIDEAQQVRGEASSPGRHRPAGRPARARVRATGRRRAGRRARRGSGRRRARSSPWRRIDVLRARVVSRSRRAIAAGVVEPEDPGQLGDGLLGAGPGVSWSGAATSRSRWTVVARTTVPVRS